MSEIHCLRVDLRQPTFAKLKQLRDLTGAGSLVAVVRRAIDEYSERVIVGKIPVIENDAPPER